MLTFMRWMAKTLWWTIVVIFLFWLLIALVVA